jgi:hypothetical protein
MHASTHLLLYRHEYQNRLQPIRSVSFRQPLNVAFHKGFRAAQKNFDDWALTVGAVAKIPQYASRDMLAAASRKMTQLIDLKEIILRF